MVESKKIFESKSLGPQGLFFFYGHAKITWPFMRREKAFRSFIRIILSLFFFAEGSESREEDILYLPSIFNFELGPGIYRDKGRSEFYVYLRLT